MFFDYTIQEIEEGYHDIELPLVKMTEKSSLLFQEVDLLLDTWEGDFKYNIKDGMPYEQILGDRDTLSRLENIYYEKLSPLKFFKDLQKFEVTMFRNRELRISFCVISDYGVEKAYYQAVFVDKNGNILNDVAGNTLVPAII